MSVALLSWKEEPLSPVADGSGESAWLSEDTLYQTCPEHDDDIKFEVDLDTCATRAEVASHLLENLEKLIDLDELIKEESYLLDEKILPILEEVEQPRAIEVPPSSFKMEYLRSPETQFLLKEFETVYDVVEFTHETLTPPQSPPSQKPILTILEPLLTPTPYEYAALSEKQPYPVPDKHLLSDVQGYRAISTPVNISMDYPSIPTPQPDIAHELAVVDELVRTRVEDMQWSSSGPSSPNSSSSSGSSNFGDCSSDDPEWVPETIESFDDAAPPLKSSKKRSKPYSRTSPVDKRSRKKEQNKNAATRYRMKKKAEIDVILTEEKELCDKNEDLEGKITDMQREIKYLKGLMRDLFKAKGLIN